VQWWQRLPSHFLPSRTHRVINPRMNSYADIGFRVDGQLIG